MLIIASICGVVNLFSSLMQASGFIPEHGVPSGRGARRWDERDASLIFPVFRHKKSTDPTVVLQNRYFRVRDQGFEPWTPWLRVRCSASWANRACSVCSFWAVPQRKIYYTAWFSKMQALFFIFLDFFFDFVYNVKKPRIYKVFRVSEI